MRLITTEDVELRCEHTPRPGAPALLLINSLGTSLEMWDAQAQALSERYELIRYDARGHGKSSAGIQREYSIAQLASDAVAVLDACGIARAHVCGISLGGMTAMYLATHWPDRALKIALCNTSPHMPPKEAWQARIDSVREQGMTAIVEAALERWFTPAFRGAEPATEARIRAMLLETNPIAYAACSAAIRDMDQRETIKSIASKTLVIGGTQDPATPPAQAELIASSIPEAKLVLLETAHLSNIERPAEFTSALLEFLAA